MIEYKTDATKGKYNIGVETDNYKHYRVIEEFVRMFIDHKLDFINNEAREAEPVKHGHWIDDHDFAICSLCNRIIYDAYYEFRDKNDASFHNYCPYCGAKMDGGADNE